MNLWTALFPSQYVWNRIATWMSVSPISRNCATNYKMTTSKYHPISKQEWRTNNTKLCGLPVKSKRKLLKKKIFLLVCVVMARKLTKKDLTVKSVKVLVNKTASCSKNLRLFWGMKSTLLSLISCSILFMSLRNWSSRKSKWFTKMRHALDAKLRPLLVSGTSAVFAPISTIAKCAKLALTMSIHSWKWEDLNNSKSLW